MATGAILAQNGDIVRFYRDIGKISREKRQDLADILPEVFCLVNVAIGWDPHSRNYKFAGPNLAPFLPKNC